MKKILFLASFFLLAITTMSNANATTEIASQVIKVEVPEVKLVASGANAAEGFMTLENKGTQNHVLIAAYSPTDVETQLHKTVMKDGVPTMEMTKQILIPAKESTYLKFGGTHIMLIGITQPLQPNTNVPINFIFDDGSEITTQAHVVS